MNIHKIPLLEILVNGVCNQGAHTEYSLEGIGSGTQMGDGAQVFKEWRFSEVDNPVRRCPPQLLLRPEFQRAVWPRAYFTRFPLQGWLCLRLI